MALFSMVYQGDICVTGECRMKNIQEKKFSNISLSPGISLTRSSHVGRGELVLLLFNKEHKQFN